jgi:hypothetical protein
VPRRSFVLADSNEDDTERDDMDSPLWTVNAVDCWVTHHTNANAITTTKPNGLLKRTIFLGRGAQKTLYTFLYSSPIRHTHTLIQLSTHLCTPPISNKGRLLSIQKSSKNVASRQKTISRSANSLRGITC